FSLLYFIIQFIIPVNNYTTFLNDWAGPILILTAANLIFNAFDTYNRNALFDAVTGATLKEFVLKISTAIVMGLMLFFALPFPLFLSIWLFANVIPSIIIFYKLKQNNHLNFNPDLKFLDKEKVHMLTNVSLFAVISGFTTMIIQYIDKIMIDGMINTS